MPSSRPCSSLAKRSSRCTAAACSKPASPRCPPGLRARLRRAHAARRSAGQPHQPRSGLDHGRGDAQPRLPDLRPALRPGCEGRYPAADGGRLDHRSGWPGLDLHPAARPCFHDGEPVLAKDCVASIQRWAKRDPFVQVLWPSIAEVEALDDRRFRFRLHRPVPLLLMALGQTQFPCFIMPERIASTDAFQQIREAVGSGPFRFLANEWNPGQRAVWAKLDRYVPRSEPVDGLAGGRVPRSIGSNGPSSRTPPRRRTA